MNYRYEMLNKEQIKKVLYNLRYCDLRIESDGQQAIVSMYYNLRQNKDNMIFTLMGELDNKKAKLINKNPKVSLGFIENDDKKVKTVIAIGKVDNIIYRDIQKNKVKIRVCVTDLSGRRYDK